MNKEKRETEAEDRDEISVLKCALYPEKINKMCKYTCTHMHTQTTQSPSKS
jgi:hypothetical protein